MSCSILQIFQLEHLKNLIYSFTDASTCFQHHQFQSLEHFSALSILIGAIHHDNYYIYQQNCKELSAVAFDYLLQLLVENPDLSNYTSFIDQTLCCNILYKKHYSKENILNNAFKIAVNRNNDKFLKRILFYHSNDICWVEIDGIIHDSIVKNLAMATILYQSISSETRQKQICQYDLIQSSIKNNNLDFLEIVLEDFPTTQYYEKIFLDYAIRMDNLIIVKYLVEKRHFKLDKTFKKNSSWIIRDYISCHLCNTKY